jgi:hypothetical protein
MTVAPGDAELLQLRIALIDSLLSDLETLILTGRSRTPESLEPALSWLLENSPVECPELSAGVSPAPLMDMLFDLQESLLALKGGDVRRRLQLEDEPPEVTAGPSHITPGHISGGR